EAGVVGPKTTKGHLMSTTSPRPMPARTTGHSSFAATALTALVLFATSAGARAQPLESPYGPPRSTPAPPSPVPSPPPAPSPADPTPSTTTASALTPPAAAG